jgi:hypothetical protein
VVLSKDSFGKHRRGERQCGRVDFDDLSEQLLIQALNSVFKQGGHSAQRQGYEGRDQ